MNSVNITADPTIEVLLNWNNELRNRNLEESHFFELQARENLSKQVYMNYSSGLGLLFYSTYARHNLLNNDLNKAAEHLGLAKDFYDYADDKYKYYYYLTLSLLEHHNTNYQEALEALLKAEVLLNSIDDEIETAYLYYRLAGQYYYMEEPILTGRYLERCMQIYESSIDANMEYIDQRKLLIECKLLYGLNLIDLSQYEEAEVLFHEALNIAQRNDDYQNLPYIYHDLGLVYSLNNNPKASILYMRKAIALRDVEHPDQDRAYFLLTKELYRDGQLTEAEALCQRGLARSEENDDREHFYKYSILHEIFTEEEKSQEILEESINYLIEKKSWLSVEEYADMIAMSFNEEREFELASKYFFLSLQARHNHKRKVK